MTGNHWGYGKEDGPSAWLKNYPVAEGDRQSPIDIIPLQASYDQSLGPIVINYDQCISINISNNGHSVVVEFDDTDDRSVIRGGPLDNPYRLKQFHFHWGGKGCHGSEHTVGGNGYASELHLVHWNAVKYKTFGEAATAPDGLAVLGIFLETGDDHRWLHTITDALYTVKFKSHRFQRLQPQMPPSQQPPLLDLLGVPDYTSLTRERHLDCPEGPDHCV
ncbi:carbonic anhydrase 7 isoform X2 [Cololabis saira]|uniref:carbonic anhydrase 7 isoform X2 n=1 Tax=Cololabis saira TaxID=129043 RepID=UPI002AD39D89|nr:carbonic anhydrase 7 isoform X2 [Cololabis saira]